MNAKLEQTDGVPADRDELDWLAFRYVSGDMTSAEAAQFEHRMGEEEAACEAMIGAVELAHAVAATAGCVSPMLAGEACARPGNRVARRWARRGMWMGLGALACSVLLVLLDGIRHDNVADLDRAATFTATPELALAWAHSRAGGTESLVPDESAGGEEFLASDHDDFEGGQFEPPSWMMTALEGLQSREGADAVAGEDASE